MPTRTPVPKPGDTKAWLRDLNDLLRSVILDEQAPARWQTVPCRFLPFGATPPGIVSFGSIELPHFDAASNESIPFTLQLPHTWYEGSDVYPYVRWSPTSADTGVVSWEFIYRWANADSPFSTATSEIIDQAGGGTAGMNLLALSTPVAADGKYIGATLVGMINRLASSGGDTYTDDAVLIDAGLLIQVDTSRGSVKRAGKWS